MAKHKTPVLCRVNPIENYDTIASRIITENEIELLFYASHATEKDINPQFNLECELAEINYNMYSNGIKAIFKDARVENYGKPDDDHQFLKMFEAIETVNDPKPLLCGLEAAKSQTIAINLIQDSISVIKQFPKSSIFRSRVESRVWVEGIDVDLLQCYNLNSLPAEMGYNWAMG